ncbi:MAG TPA: peroxiredoxin [Planctomycetota bacterium]|nr:peroxiredoxin [Planctomycetota bacterium]
MNRLLLVLLLALPAYPQDSKQAPAAVDPAKAGIGRSYKDTAVGALLQDAKVVVVAFSGPDCPISKLYKPRLDRLSKDYSPKGVRILTVSSDDKGFLALFGPERTTETFVLDDKGVLRYRGAVDDQYGIGYTKDAPSKNYLVDAIEGLLVGKAPAVAATEAPGCAVEKVAKPGAPGAAPAGKITFHKDVEPIFQKRCAECHRPGDIGPFSLLKYDKAKSSAKQIKEVVVKRRMPPWHADPKVGEWKNDRHLSTQEINTIAGWVDAGAPEGDAKDAPPAPKFPEGWRIGTPDATWSIPRREKIPAEGSVPYRNLFVPTGLKEDKWVQAVEVRPGARQVVHHVLVFVIYPLNRLKEQPKIDGLNGWVGIYVPGEGPMVFPEGSGKYIPAGATLGFQIHYTTNGEAAEDQTQVGFIWAKKKPEHEVVTQSATSRRLRIPAGAADHPEEGAFTFPEDGKILSLLPHMHVRGKAFKYVAVTPDGKEELLLDVPRYDFNWQTCYRLKEPKPVKKGTVVRAYARFDNSSGNPANPDPSKDVRWGEQTWEEMLVGFIDYMKD